MNLRYLSARLISWLLPPRCVACNSPAIHTNKQTSPRDLCAACLATLPFNVHACVRCALPLPNHSGALLCGHCVRRAPLYAQACCALRYEYPAQQLIQRLKFGASLPEATVLGQLLGQQLQQHYQQQQLAWPQCIVPVPLHAARYRQRGYNQVMELGQAVAQVVGVPMNTHLLKRERNTPEQSGLTRSERRKNLRGAFAMLTSQVPIHVALLDDVITTGSTVHELTRVLRKAGVQQVDVWGVARAD